MSRDPRISRDEMFLQMAELVAKRSSCRRGSVGAIIVHESRPISMGYNGAPPNSPHCWELGCDTWENVHVEGCQRAIHAEANSIAWAARFGVPTRSATMYSTHSPCLDCSKLVVAAGIERFVYRIPYRAERLDILAEGRVEVVHLG